MEYETGEVGRGGARECTAEFVFRGKLGQRFLEFTVARARWLGLRGSSRIAGSDVIAVVSGQEALVDSFEVTCSLGPIDATVDDWVRNEPGPSEPPVPPGGSDHEF